MGWRRRLRLVWVGILVTGFSFALVTTIGGGVPFSESAAGARPVPAGTGTAGYWLAAADGGVFSYAAPFLGNPRTSGSNICVAPTTVDASICRGIASTPDGGGYWIVSSETFEGGINGRVSGFGDVALSNPPPLSGLNAELVGVATTDGAGHGGGLWLAGADGGVFAYGDAPFEGSMGGVSLRAPVVGIVSDPVASGYWLVASDGGVFAFGAARFFGSMATGPAAQTIVGMAATPDGAGYWLVTSGGFVVPFGDAAYFGSLAGQPYMGRIPLNGPIVGMAATADGQGYWLVGSDGGVFAFGDAPFLGSMGARTLVAPVVGISRAG